MGNRENCPNTGVCVCLCVCVCVCVSKVLDECETAFKGSASSSGLYLGFFINIISC